MCPFIHTHTHTHTIASTRTNVQLNFHNNEELMKSATKCCKRTSLCGALEYRPRPLYKTNNNVPSFAPSPVPLLHFFFFSSLVSSVRDPITVIKSVDPQRALLQTDRKGGRHGRGEIWLEGRKWMERGFRERWRSEGEMKRWMRAWRKRHEQICHTTNCEESDFKVYM